MTNSDKQYYTVKEFSRIIGVHYNTVRRGIERGTIHAINIGTGERDIWRIHHTEFNRLGVMRGQSTFLKQAN